MAVVIVFKSGAVVPIDVDPTVSRDADGKTGWDFEAERDQVLFLDKTEIAAVIHRLPEEQQFLGR